MLQAGTIVAQHLRLIRQLGSGGMGSVWVAEHLRIGGQVAVKFLSTALLDHESARSRFVREAKWAAKIRSPHVVQVHDHGVMPGEHAIPYIVMELLEGRDLSRVLEEEGPFGIARATEILEQVCEALTKAHEAGVVHRDIKPENVFLLAQDKTFVKLLDFGVAHGNDGQIDRLTQTGLLLGTAHYMSPEQLFSGKDIDHRADLWALAVLTYQMLTTRVPFQAETFGQLCLAVRDGTFPAVSVAVNVSPSMNQWFDRALCTERDGRFQSAMEMYDAFVRAAAGESVGLGAVPQSGEQEVKRAKDATGTVRVTASDMERQRRQLREAPQTSDHAPHTLRMGTGDTGGSANGGSSAGTGGSANGGSSAGTGGSANGGSFARANSSALGSSSVNDATWSESSPGSTVVEGTALVDLADSFGTESKAALSFSPGAEERQPQHRPRTGLWLTLAAIAVASGIGGFVLRPQAPGETPPGVAANVSVEQEVAPSGSDPARGQPDPPHANPRAPQTADAVSVLPPAPSIVANPVSSEVPVAAALKAENPLPGANSASVASKKAVTAKARPSGGKAGVAAPSPNGNSNTDTVGAPQSRPHATSPLPSAKPKYRGF